MATRRATSAPRSRSSTRCWQYYDLGITKFLIRGFDPLRDVEEWGDELIPLLRKGAAERATPAAVSLSA